MSLRSARVLFLTLVIPASFGCTSFYALPPDAIALRSKLDEKAAAAIIAEAIKPHVTEGNPGFGGLLLGSGNADSPLAFGSRLVGRTLEYDLSGPDVAWDESPPEHCRKDPDMPRELPDTPFRTSSKVGTRCSHAIQLDHVADMGIRAVEGGGAFVRGYIVSVKESPFRWVDINVPPDWLPRLMAGLTYFAPQARLTQAKF